MDSNGLKWTQMDSNGLTQGEENRLHTNIYNESYIRYCVYIIQYRLENIANERYLSLDNVHLYVQKNYSDVEIKCFAIAVLLRQSYAASLWPLEKYG